MPQLAVGVQFLSEFSSLQVTVQKRTMEALTKFQQHTHAGAHLEKLVNAQDDRARTIRIDKFWRGVVVAPEHGDRYVLLRVLPHDDAIHWARTRTFTVNQVSGVLEVRDVAALSELAGAGPPPVQANPLFTEVSDKDLARLGIDDQVRVLARTLLDEAALDAVAPFLPENQSEVLYALASGMTVEEVWADAVAPRVPAEPIDPEDLVAAAERTQGRIALVDGPDELLDLFDKPLALWRTFLHPAQEQLAYRPSYSGSAQVTGGPGTGKTVVALHRVQHLVTREPLPPASVLLTTYTTGLGAALDRDLAQMLEPASMRAVQVTNVDKWAMAVVRGEHGAPVVVDEEEVRQRWRAAITETGVPFSPAFLDDEWRHVVLAGDVHDQEGYLTASRRGRGRALGRAQRVEVWRAVAAFVAALRADRRWTWLTLADEAARLVRSRERAPFRHVVVDEVQDLHPAQWRLLRAAVAPGPDDLFLTGDPHQRIYGNHVSLKRVGVAVGGRSARLTINYRTTAEILGWSLRVLDGAGVDDLDGGTDSLAGYHSALTGEPPTLRGTANPADEAAALVATIRAWSADGVDLSDIAVVGRTRPATQPFRKALERANLGTTDLGGDGVDKVRIGTMHGMKGLEFRCVAIVGVGDGQVPLPQAVTPMAEDEVRHALDLRQERCLLFVACTRARERLHVSWSGAASSILPSGPRPDTKA